MGEVIKFRNIGSYLEELVEFAGDRNGTVTMAIKDEGKTKLWFGMLSFVQDGSGEHVRKQVTSGSFNGMVMRLREQMIVQKGIPANV